MFNRKKLKQLFLIGVVLLSITSLVYKQGFNYHPVVISCSLEKDSLNDIEVIAYSPWNTKRKLYKFGNNSFYLPGAVVSKLEIKGEDISLIKKVHSSHSILSINRNYMLQPHKINDETMLLSNLRYNIFNLSERGINWKGDLYFIIQVLFFSSLVIIIANLLSKL